MGKWSLAALNAAPRSTRKFLREGAMSGEAKKWSSCNGLDPEAYLAEVIDRLPEHATAEQAAELTPAKIAAARRLAEDAA